MIKEVRNLDLETSWKFINQNFPFQNYINPKRKSGYFDMVKFVDAYFPNKNAKILDFGAGPCDKTAMFSLHGYDVTAFDTLDDFWHKHDNNRNKIKSFAKKVGIKYLTPTKKQQLPFSKMKFDVIMLHDVLEHFHSSPREILNLLVGCLNPNGYLVVTVPNAGNIKKRLKLLFGYTNYGRYDYFYWYPGPWNGHVREYVKGDLKQLNYFLKLKPKLLTSYHLQLDVLPSLLHLPFKLLTTFFPSFRDSWMMISQKTNKWKPALTPTKEIKKKALGWHYFDMSKIPFKYDKKEK